MLHLQFTAVLTALLLSDENQCLDLEKLCVAWRGCICSVIQKVWGACLSSEVMLSLSVKEPLKFDQVHFYQINAIRHISNMLQTSASWQRYECQWSLLAWFSLSLKAEVYMCGLHPEPFLFFPLIVALREPSGTLQGVMKGWDRKRWMVLESC